MHVAQSGIFALGTGSHSYLECDLLEHADPGALVQAIANLREPRTTTGGVNLVAGFRPSLWRRIALQELPAGATDFEQVVRGVDGYSMSATQHGTMFIGFSCDQQRLIRILARMAGAEDGIRDALTRYTTAVSVAYYARPICRSAAEVCLRGRQRSML